MTAEQLETRRRHRGTWPTILVLAIFAIGVCAIVFGFFSLPASTLRGISMMAVGAGLTAPGVWWLRWYQNPRLLWFVAPASALLFVPGAAGLALENRGPVVEDDVVVADTSETPSPPTTRLATTLTSAPSSYESETTEAPSSDQSTLPSEPLVGEPTPTPETETSTPPLVPPAPLSPAQPAPVQPAPVQPAPVQPTPTTPPAQTGEPTPTPPPVETTAPPEETTAEVDPQPQGPNERFDQLLRQILP